MRRSHPRRAFLLAALAVATLSLPGAASAQARRGRVLDESRTRPSTAARPSPPASPRLDAARRGDDATFRPTVVIRRGTSQGTGTIIATAADSSLVLTAAHVVRDKGDLVVELHRYNVGLEKSSGGGWPLVIPAEVVGVDDAGDVAVLRLRGPSPLPFIARLYDDDPAGIAPGAAVTSLGVDQGARVASWDTRVVEPARFRIDEESAERPFLITEKIPAHGRSGGGLFLADGRLVGVCVGHAELYEGRRMGVFASLASARRLIREHGLDAEIARSQARPPASAAASSTPR
jgi:S1-C subfamily serine protease